MIPGPVRVAQRSFVGARAHNEDCSGVERSGSHWCCVLSDGAGGHSDGALAARLVVERVLEGFRSRPPADPKDLAELLLDAHDAIVATQRARGTVASLSAMHATVVALLVDTATGLALWGNVGDSRLYLARDGAARAVTRDDSVWQWMLDTGAVDPARLQDAPHRGVLLAALGSDDEIEPHVSEPFEVRAADAFLLCSDGWWGGVESGRIEAALAGAREPGDWLDAMAQTIAQVGEPRQDNYTAIACWIGERPVAGFADVEDETIVPASRSRPQGTQGNG